MLYITYVDLYEDGYFGVSKKIMSQLSVFKKFFGKVYLTCYCGQTVYLLEDGRVVDKELAVTRARCHTVVGKWLDKYNIKRTYIRYAFSDKWFLQFLKLQKEKGIKAVLEIPTYPYDGEIAGERFKRIRLEDSYYREHLCQYVDWVATNSEAEQILGMSCIKLLNGVDIELHPMCLKSRTGNEISKKIVLIGVSIMAIWHGYERVLEGLFHYYKNKGSYDIYLKLVGEGAEKNRYQSLVQKYGLQSKVEFCGMLGGEDLNRQYASADIAVSSLGLYKTGIEDVTPIKGAEYCARGIPFICGYHDMRFPDKADYIMTVPNNPEPINMHEVIAFYETITAQENYQKKMRNYALEHFTWESIMMPVVELLNGF
ncbi:MAG: glycosyltransferase family 4 protein [Lachnospiraceae bacterium]|nr:glycosyltransferase family 4 protein [Lachnospiraceae bacterium]